MIFVLGPPISVGTPKGVELALKKNVFDCNDPISKSIAAILPAMAKTDASNATTCAWKAMICKVVMSDLTKDAVCVNMVTISLPD